MLFYYDNAITRVQCPLISSAEVQRIIDFIACQPGYPAAYPLPEVLGGKNAIQAEFDMTDTDPLFEEAARLVVINQLGSTSLIQRKMKLGYNRAGHLMDQLEAAGVVGFGTGSQARDVLIRSEMELNQFLCRFQRPGRRTT
jgi:S-DNA-T family DNA segregation ATPase FtsK/SpoIIIE